MKLKSISEKIQCSFVCESREIIEKKHFKTFKLFSSKMCFLTYIVSGCPTKCLKTKKIRTNNHSENESLIENNFKVVAIHKRQDLLDETIKLINSHWPKSRSERLSILGSSKDDLPMSLILIVKQNGSEAEVMKSMFGEYQARGKNIRVFGHLRLVPVPADEKSCFVESMVVHHDMRGD